MNKTKYRIILREGWFYPQYKGWILWHDIQYIGLARYCFDKLEDAERFIESRRDYKQENGFEIVKEYE